MVKGKIARIRCKKFFKCVIRTPSRVFRVAKTQVIKLIIYSFESYYTALQLEEDPFDETYICYQLGNIYSNNGDYSTAFKYYFRGLS